MVKELQGIDLDKMRLYMNIWTLLILLSSVSYFVSWKTEVDIVMKQDKVSTTDFAVLKNDVAYIKESVKLLLEKKD